MTTLEFWSVAGGSVLALLLTFMMVGGGFFVALAVLAAIPVALAWIAASGSEQPRPEKVPEPEPVVQPATQPAPPSRTPTTRSRWAAYAFYGVVIAGAAVADLYLWLGLYHLAAIAFLASMVGLLLVLADTAPAFARRFREELRLVERVTAPGQPMALLVVASKGSCAWGYHDADRWSISAEGQVRPKVCQAAAMGIAAALQTRAGQSVAECPFACSCPLADREVTFRLGPMPAAA